MAGRDALVASKLSTVAHLVGVSGSSVDEVAMGVAENSSGAADGVLVVSDRSFAGKVAIVACRYLASKVEMVPLLVGMYWLVKLQW